ncbi:rho-type GTPase activating protein Rga8 [Schizosaccharomyces octosporus yFS286]|uniref:Rho-type GTPase activating protein Rga8 n=1 Tax=Schizosaccharomyces octosporus (strain yFS286) TaxID=483514 RepID=S9Q483_SCHOY|nr:rho-type GTPase activating protein Rga8 [Schizosaccharomyces octosporus yFS286]EPX74473.1 rho-type GTPase activating protein Rga8 [Schizosaccharomyces octosporus yFS286]
MATISSFSNGFWSKDYATGINTLFERLSLGTQENEQVKTLIKLYKQANEDFGERLQEITKECMKNGNKEETNEDCTSSSKAFEGLRSEIETQGKQHVRISNDLQSLVLRPLSKMSVDHEQKLQTSQYVLTNHTKEYEKKYHIMKKAKSTYYNRCRDVEDLEEEAKREEEQEGSSDLKTSNNQFSSGSSGAYENSESSEQNGPVQLGFMEFKFDELQKVMSQILEELPLQDKRVPILGTYQNTCSGNIIVSWLQENLPVPTLVAAEAFGQDLIAEGFLRQIGQIGVGGTFVNSTNFYYQWKEKAFQVAGLDSHDALVENAKSLPFLGEYLSDYIQYRKQYAMESPLQRAHREAVDANTSYKEAVYDLDKCRTLLEENIVDHFQFLQKCEVERVKYFKNTFMDMSTIISNFLPSMKLLADQIIVYQEIIQPDSDIRYILESSATGPFLPHVEVYEDYYNDIKDQVFGIDMEFLCHRDKKRVPIIVSTILSFLDQLYPTLPSDKVRQQLWLVNSPLSSIHQLREALNYAPNVSKDILVQYSPTVVVGTLKLFLLELPDSIIPSSAFELIRSIYANHGNDEVYRVRLLQNLLSQLRRVNLATLSAIITHLHRLISLTTKETNFVGDLANSLCMCISRPTSWTLSIQHDKHPSRFLEDLLTHGPTLFEELRKLSAAKRASDRGPSTLIAGDKQSASRKASVSSTASAPTSAPYASPRSSLDEARPSVSEAEFTTDNVPSTLLRTSYASNARRGRRNVSQASQVSDTSEFSEQEFKDPSTDDTERGEIWQSFGNQE